MNHQSTKGPNQMDRFRYRGYEGQSSIYYRFPAILQSCTNKTIYLHADIFTLNTMEIAF